MEGQFIFNLPAEALALPELKWSSAVWTRFNPNLIAIQKALHDDQVIGEVTSLHCNLSLNAIGRRPDSDRVLAAELAGGALLDLGPYPWTWVSPGTMTVVLRIGLAALNGAC